MRRHHGSGLLQALRVAAALAVACAAAGAPATATATTPAGELQYRAAGLLGDPRFHHAGTLTSVTALPGGKQVLTSARDGTARLWEYPSGREIRRFACTDSDVWHAVLVPGGKQILTSGGDHEITLWDLESGTSVRTFRHEGTAFRIAVTPDGKEMYATDNNKQIVRWELATGKKLGMLSGHTDAVYGAAIAPDGKTLVSCGSDKTVRVWNLPEGTARHVLRGHGEAAYTVAYSPREARAASVGDRTVRVWDTAAGTEVWNATLPASAKVVAYSPDGKMVAALGDDTGWLCTFDAATGAEKLKLELPGRTHYPVGFSADGTEVFVAVESLVARWNVATGKQVFPEEEAGGGFAYGAVHDVEAAPDGKRLYSGRQDGSLNVWEVACGQRTRLAMHDGAVTRLALAPDGSRVLAGVKDERAVIYAAPAAGAVGPLKELQRLTRPESISGGLWAFADGGKRVVSAGRRGGFEVWNATTGEVQHSVTGTSDDYRATTLACDEQHVVTTDGKGALRIYSVNTAAELTTLPVGEKRLTGGVLAARGRYLLVAEEGNRLRAWRRLGEAATRPARPEEITRWVKELGADDFQAREAAVRKLIEAGPEVERYLRQADPNDAEVGERVGMVRQGLQRGTVPEKELGEGLELPGAPGAMVAHPDGRHFAVTVGSWTASGEIVIGEFGEGALKIVQRWSDGHGPCSLTFSRDGKTLYVGNRDGTISVWSAVSGQEEKSETTDEHR